MITRSMTAAAIAAAVLTWSGLPSPAAADAVEDFYKGKTMTILVGYGGRSTYSIYARLLSQWLVKYLPGKPLMINKIMGGAGGMKAANYLFNVAPKDGSWIGAVGRGLATEPLVFGKRSRAKFDPMKFRYIGSLNTEVGLATAWHKTGINSIADLRRKQIHVSIGGVASDSGVFTIISNAILGTKFKIVCCFSGGGSQNLAMERGEVGGRVGWSWSSIKATRLHWIKEGKVKLIYQLALQKHPELPDVPLALDLVEDPDDKEVLKIALIRQSMGRPYMTPPGVPAARVAALRTAFDTMVRDPAFLAAAKKMKLEINRPISGKAIHALLDRAYKTPKAILERTAAAVDPKNADVWHKYKRKRRKKKK